MNVCRFEGCERPVHVQVRGLCKNHYDQARGKGEVPSRKRQPETCTADGCDRRCQAKGLCDMHYRRLKINGTTERRTLLDRFLSFVPERSSDGYCWEWTGNKAQGYGRLRIGNTHAQAHRVSYELFVGPIPEGLHLDHLCMNKGCVNPEHLEAVTQRENNLRSSNMAGAYMRRNECHICGGELTFYPNRGKYGVRVCKACQRRRSAKSRARANAAP